MRQAAHAARVQVTNGGADPPKPPLSAPAKSPPPPASAPAPPSAHGKAGDAGAGAGRDGGRESAADAAYVDPAEVAHRWRVRETNSNSRMRGLDPAEVAHRGWVYFG